MSLSEAMKRLKSDKRLTENFLKYGELSPQDVEKQLAELEDVSANAEKMNLFETEDSQENQQH
jgi:hypothetical protein